MKSILFAASLLLLAGVAFGIPQVPVPGSDSQPRPHGLHYLQEHLRFRGVIRADNGTNGTDGGGGGGGSNSSSCAFSRRRGVEYSNESLSAFGTTNLYVDGAKVRSFVVNVPAANASSRLEKYVPYAAGVEFNENAVVNGPNTNISEIQDGTVPYIGVQLFLPPQEQFLFPILYLTTIVLPVNGTWYAFLTTYYELPFSNNSNSGTIDDNLLPDGFERDSSSGLYFARACNLPNGTSIALLGLNGHIAASRVGFRLKVIQDRTDTCWSFPQADRVARAGYYPHLLCLHYEPNVYTIQWADFRFIASGKAKRL